MAVVMMMVLAIVLLTGWILCPANLRRMVSGFPGWRACVLFVPLLLLLLPLLAPFRIVDLLVWLLPFSSVFEWSNGGETATGRYRDSNHYKHCAMTSSIVSEIWRRHRNALCHAIGNIGIGTQKSNGLAEHTQHKKRWWSGERREAGGDLVRRRGRLKVEMDRRHDFQEGASGRSRG